MEVTFSMVLDPSVVRMHSLFIRTGLLLHVIFGTSEGQLMIVRLSFKYMCG